MKNPETQYPEFYRHNPWDDADSILSISDSTILPASCFFPEDGIPQRSPNSFSVYRFDLMLEAESALRSFLGLMVDFRQRRKLTQFLLGLCDLLEITYDKNTGTLKECRFQVEFSNRVSITYSSRMCGCIIALDGKQDSFHHITPQAIDDLRSILTEIWETIRELPIWEVAGQKGDDVYIERKLPFPI